MLNARHGFPQLTAALMSDSRECSSPAGLRMWSRQMWLVTIAPCEYPPNAIKPGVEAIAATPFATPVLTEAPILMVAYGYPIGRKFQLGGAVDNPSIRSITGVHGFGPIAIAVCHGYCPGSV